MTRINKILFVILILTFSVFETFGGGQNRAGTAAAPELRIPIGARYLAMFGSNVGSISGLEAIYWNPAGVDFSANAADALFSHRSYIADMNLNFVAISGRLSDFGSLGLSFRSLNIGEINVTTLDQPDGTGQIINPSYFTLSLTYSKKLTDRVSVGGNLNLISETIDKVSATGVGFDFGVQYKSLFDVGGFDLGVVVKNIGSSMKFDGNGLYYEGQSTIGERGPTFLKIEAASAALPSEIILGLSYQTSFDADNSLMVSTSFHNNNYSYDDYKVGTEYSFRNLVFARAGYLFSPQATDATPNIYQNFALGFGVNFKEISDLNIVLDYAYVPVKYFDANHVFSIALGF